MRCRGTATTGVSAWWRRTKIAACARGFNSSVNGMGANVKTGDILINSSVSHYAIVYSTVNYYIYETIIITLY